MCEGGVGHEDVRQAPSKLSISNQDSISHLELKLSFFSFYCQLRCNTARKSITFCPTDASCTDLCSSGSMLALPLVNCNPSHIPFLILLFLISEII